MMRKLVERIIKNWETISDITVFLFSIIFMLSVIVVSFAVFQMFTDYIDNFEVFINQCEILNYGKESK